ncbi:unnamed protein product, partial [Dicrocoelium dendriticum]
MKRQLGSGIRLEPYSMNCSNPVLLNLSDASDVKMLYFQCRQLRQLTPSSEIAFKSPTRSYTPSPQFVENCWTTANPWIPQQNLEVQTSASHTDEFFGRRWNWPPPSLLPNLTYQERHRLIIQFLNL